jgi:hypothetical protein
MSISLWSLTPETFSSDNERMPKRRHSLRKRLMVRARRGEFASPAEIAMVASVAWQTANRWLREGRIDLGAARLQHLARVLQKESDGVAHPARAHLTEDQRRASIRKAVRQFNEAQAKRHLQPGRSVGVASQAKNGS